MSDQRWRRNAYISGGIETLGRLERKLSGAVLTSEDAMAETADEVADELEKLAAALRARRKA